MRRSPLWSIASCARSRWCVCKAKVRLLEWNGWGKGETAMLMKTKMLLLRLDEAVMDQLWLILIYRCSCCCRFPLIRAAIVGCNFVCTSDVGAMSSTCMPAVVRRNILRGEVEILYDGGQQHRSRPKPRLELRDGR